MKEGAIEYSLKVTRVGRDGHPEYATELVIGIRPYNEGFLESLRSCLGLVDSKLVQGLIEDIREKLSTNPDQDLFYSRTRHLLPSFQEENPVTKEEPGELTKDQAD